MKKSQVTFLSVFLALVCVSLVFAGLMNTQLITNSTGSAPFTIEQNATVYTHSFPMKSGDYFGLGYKAVSSASTPNITISLEQSFLQPLTEGSSDLNYTAPDGVGAIATEMITETQHYVNITTVPAPYGRIKITENNSTNDTEVTLRLTTIE